ncbi:MAG: hypothetical protein COU07_02645 [Candidatus Harrisonbacteria bacterium CG10_big_fil_rev_8_21_14_0_10_40_38]|uniref:General secretion pathway GspH domain-containing protein n=1 Tax=Candidatus Harrisonbacteria bacterium CG10_big_fil_rev_8_21_14_0_10_40_38 TaxID=1974583 RepID=A0A2H0URW4_9BACT|nr:MAG: hypothetical protein COU07_02645 [Candidatus Harrisonbacteria bacterium CG10_big_fil_rev_8_21_14_0_10_40_38]
MKKWSTPKNGFSLIEIMIVMAIIIVLGTITSLNLFNERTRKELDVTEKSIVAVLREAQQKSITQEDESEWGVAFVDDTSDYYELTKDSTSYGKQNIIKSSLEFESVTDVSFAKITGEPSVNGDIVIIKISGTDCLLEAEKCKTITINSNGTITYD